MEWLEEPYGANAQEVQNYYVAFIITAIVSWTHLIQISLTYFVVLDVDSVLTT